MNELSDAIIAPKRDKAVPQILERLLDYIQFHFETKKEVMCKGNSPNLDKCCQEKIGMTKGVLEFIKTILRTRVQS